MRVGACAQSAVLPHSASCGTARLPNQGTDAPAGSFGASGGAAVGLTPSRKIDPALVPALHALPGGGGDLAFRNLGGQATQHRPVTRETGTLTVNVTMTNVSRSAGMVIQHYDLRVRDRLGKVYEGTTYFGFFSRPALANQVGIREAKVPWPAGPEAARAERGELPHHPPFPGPMMRMIDRVESFIPDGGSKGLGLAVGRHGSGSGGASDGGGRGDREGTRRSGRKMRTMRIGCDQGRSGPARHPAASSAWRRRPTIHVWTGGRT